MLAVSFHVRDSVRVWVRDGVRYIPKSTWLIPFWHKSTRMRYRASWVQRVELCCSTSSAQLKCIGLTHWRCGDVTSQVKFGLMVLALASGLGLGIILTIAVSNLGSGDSKVNAYSHEYPHTTTSIIVRLFKIFTTNRLYICHLFPLYSRKIALYFTFSITA